ncbi:thioredoxin H-type 2-like [Panicum miliaceum]|uniref:Thioredoxin H-type 2-like n=1 Tax=Panicum miliaceum TaxID=4540 RepID=A0A3L6SV96_PANMI|nr:thioredoxin H-type 2-like [Panicum miliaceum]
MPKLITVKSVADGPGLKEIMKRNADEDGNKLLVLEFMAPWSEPCKYMAKVLDGKTPGSGLAYELQDYADFYALDIAKFKQFAQRMTVEALPTFLLLKQGYTVVGHVVGVDKEELRSNIKKHKAESAGAGLKTVKPEEDIDKPLSLLTSPYAFLMTKLRSCF